MLSYFLAKKKGVSNIIIQGGTEGYEVICTGVSCFEYILCKQEKMTRNQIWQTVLKVTIVKSLLSILS